MWKQETNGQHYGIQISELILRDEKKPAYLTKSGVGGGGDVKEKDGRNSLKEVKFNYPSQQAWKIFSLCTFILSNATNMWHVLQIAQHANPCYLPKLAGDFQMEEVSVRKTLLQEDQECCTGAYSCHQSFQGQQATSSRAPATQKPSCRPGQPRQPTHQANCWGLSQTIISEFLKDVLLEEARSFEK